ncbi:methyl-accepting chemotaxis protein [Tissierella carlieri]|uniref:Methyl-accepting chemotaxis protein n=1 Tax=Tissierella carlieri TaxID=689904 RepID=A0ABT1S9B1_9FIRM|nr:methyl-accepting chemotaxis protein [Tissierella carlieri]MCQ4923068.1 methyl-accepting chemotaxis protein [Tissierella carlieri]
MLKKRNSIKGKILTMSILVLIVSNIAIGLLGYTISKRQLNEKGEIILENAVEAAIQMIDLAQQGVEKGLYTLPQAQEMIKENLLGKMTAEGTRPIDSPLDLGENGYFVVYSQEGDEIAHPSLEGKNVWDVKDKSKDEVLLAQDSIAKAKSGGGFTYYDWFLPHSENIGRKIVYNKLDPNWGWVVTAGSYEMDFNKGALNVLKYTSIGVVIFLVLVTVIMYSFSHKMGKALETVTIRAENIASLDVSENISEALINRNDEIGMLANSFQRIIDNLRGFVKQISDTSEHLAISSKELTISSEQSAVSANEVAKAIEDIAQGATHQAMDTENGAKHINDLGELVENNEEFLRELNISTGEIDKLKDEGFEILRELIKNTESNNRATMNIQDVIYSTNESAEKIEKASNMIRSIAEQTNLLALNAAIEAARAGEAGRGFAVVAEEIRKLAEESNGFTEDITAIVNDLSSKTQEAVATMDEVAKIAELQSESVEETNNKFIGIANAIEKSNDVISFINKSGKEIMDKKDIIVEIIQTLSAISEENAAGTEEASASVEEQTATMTQIANASQILGELAFSMQESLSKFKY